MQISVQKLLIVGLGDVAKRALPALLADWDVTALTRTVQGAPQHEHLRVVAFDLDTPVWSEMQLAILTQDYDAVLWTASPSAIDKHATRMSRVVALWLNKATWRPKRLVYISTTGVYGDCAGSWVDEQSPVHAESRRAQARLLDEQLWANLTLAIGAQAYVLRAPGIYALERLPLQSVLSRAPVMFAAEDSFSNHIHADDLAGAVVYGLSDAPTLAQNPCVINVCDDAPILMGQWYAALAKAAHLPSPKQLTRAQMQSYVAPMRWSFMRESRRISNTKLHAWGYSLKYPSAIEFVEQHQTLILEQAKILSNTVGGIDVSK